MNKTPKYIYLFLIITFVAVCAFLIKIASSKNYQGRIMMGHIASQLSFGPRHVGSEGRIKAQQFIINNIKQNDIEVVEQNWEDSTNKKLKNIIARINPEAVDRTIIGTHYDSQESASLDRPDSPVPGANDSASGVALLLELANNLKSNSKGIDLVFFDAEEYQPGNFDSWEPKGSTFFANNLPELYGNDKPRQSIIVDMLCDKNLNIQKEFLSSQNAKIQTEDIWTIGKSIDSKSFDSNVRSEIKDDHTPLAKVGIPSTLIIDFDYPHFHTTKDTIDKCSAKSLQISFDTLITYLFKK